MSKEWRSQVYRLLFLLVVLTLINGCSSSEPNPPGTPVVTQEKAKAVAQEVYSLMNIDAVDLRHLTEDELNLLNEEQAQLTPIYYVMKGLVKDEQVTIYVSSHEINHHFIIRK